MNGLGSDQRLGNAAIDGNAQTNKPCKWRQIGINRSKNEEKEEALHHKKGEEKRIDLL